MTGTPRRTVLVLLAPCACRRHRSWHRAGPQNAQAIDDNYDSGQAKRDQQATAKAAQTWIYSSVDSTCNGKPESCDATVVFDIDETLLSDGFAVVLLTGRADSERSATAECLRKRGIKEWHELILCTQAEASLSADVYKSQHRADLQAEGHRIVASIGDQVSDMSKGRLKARFLLPNLMYFIP